MVPLWKSLSAAYKSFNKALSHLSCPTYPPTYFCTRIDLSVYQGWTSCVILLESWKRWPWFFFTHAYIWLILVVGPVVNRYLGLLLFFQLLLCGCGEEWKGLCMSHATPSHHLFSLPYFLSWGNLQSFEWMEHNMIVEASESKKKKKW